MIQFMQASENERQCSYGPGCPDPSPAISVQFTLKIHVWHSQKSPKMH